MPIPSLPKSGTPTTFLSSAIQGSTLLGTAGNDQLTAGALSVTLSGGAGDDTYIAFKASSGAFPSSTKVVEAVGGGIDTVISGWSYKLPANVENLTLTNIGIFQYATGNSGDNIITGGIGNNYITTGGGNDVLYGGGSGGLYGGTDVFIPTKDANTTTWIGDFGADDRLILTKLGFYSLDAVNAKTSQVGSDVKIDLGDGQTLMLANQTTSVLTSSTVVVDNLVGARRLTFSDEFNGPLSLNTGTAATADGTWKTRFNSGDRTLYGNGELQLYVDPDYKGTLGTPLGLNPFSIDDGILKISARPVDASVAPYVKGMQYTSGLLTSETSFQQQYGYFEIRAQNPSEKGMFPAFWLLAPDQWPPEIDVYEQVGGQPGYVNQGIFTATDRSSNKGIYTGVDMSKDFHTYALEWTSQKLTWFIDGKQTWQTDTPADMHQPMYVLFNLAVGGNWAGPPDATTDWAAADLLVDYVRVYQLDGGLTAPTPTPTPTPTATPTPTPEPIPTPEPEPEATPEPTATPQPIPTPATWSGIAVSEGEDPFNVSERFDIALTGPNTSTTYSIPLIQVATGVASVTASFDGQNKVILVNNSAWNTIKSALVTFTGGDGATVKNFVDVEITMGGANDAINVTGMKRGTISSGDGNDTITIAGYSNMAGTTGYGNLSKVLAGAGNDSITYTGNSYNKVHLDGGDGNDVLKLGGQAYGTAVGGLGTDKFTVTSTGNLKLTGGAGADTFAITKGAHVEITDYQVGVDHIDLSGTKAAKVKVSVVGGDTVIDLGQGSSVELLGVSLTKAQLDLHYV